jgi:hypothetical protein
MGIVGAVSSWVHTSDDNGALQFLPNDGAVGNSSVYDVPALYIGNSTGEMIRGLIRSGQVDSCTLVLDAPSYFAPTETVIGHLDGTTYKDDTIIIYTHSKVSIPLFIYVRADLHNRTGDGPSIIEENGALKPILFAYLNLRIRSHPTPHHCGVFCAASSFHKSRVSHLQ